MFCEESEEVLPGGDRAAAPAVGTKDTSGRAKFNFLEDTGGRFSLLLPCMVGRTQVQKSVVGSARTRISQVWYLKTISDVCVI